MDYRLNLGAWRKVFAVPSCVADEHHLKLATGTQIKVLLYMLAYPDLGIRDDNIASELGISREDVSDALLYWVNAGILANEGDEYYPSSQSHAPAVPAVRVQPAASAPADPPVSSMSTPEARAALASETQFPPKVIAGAVNGDSAVKYLFETYQRLAGRPLKHSEQQTLMVLVEEVGLPCEVTMMLVEYCFNIDKATPAYMKAVGRDWIDNGINDIPKAEERIKQLTEYYGTEAALRKTFGLATSFSAKQKQYISDWLTLGMSKEMITEAYNAALDGTGKMSFPYMDKILRTWAAEGITVPSAIQTRRKPEPAPDSAPSYNTEEIEQRTYNKYKNLNKRGTQ